MAVCPIPDPGDLDAFRFATLSTWRGGLAFECSLVVSRRRCPCAPAPVPECSGGGKRMVPITWHSKVLFAVFQWVDWCRGGHRGFTLPKGEGPAAVDHPLAMEVRQGVQQLPRPLRHHCGRPAGITAGTAPGAGQECPPNDPAQNNSGLHRWPHTEHVPVLTQVHTV